jgi:hypothetical protein
VERANGFPLFVIGESIGIVAQSIVAFSKVGDSRVPAKNMALVAAFVTDFDRGHDLQAPAAP